jgi:predicted house-cleaning noncanonical NTP pyrophosphatase (MazG superfamily)
MERSTHRIVSKKEGWRRTLYLKLQDEAKEFIEKARDLLEELNIVQEDKGRILG